MRCLEFFSGIGGLHYGASAVRAHPALGRLEVVAAFDINIHANACYQHNFQLKPVTKSLEYMNMSEILKYQVQCWLMSPPCQPFTKGGSKRDDEDPRTKGLLKLISFLPKMSWEQRPMYILLENVPGFDTSRTRQRFIDTLDAASYDYWEFFLSPEQFGYPYKRLRYFLTAKKKGSENSEATVQESSKEVKKKSKIDKIIDQPFWISPIQNPPTLKSFLDENIDTSFAIPEERLLKQKNFRYDIVQPTGTFCQCFTKHYATHHVFTSGSFLQTKNFDKLSEYVGTNQSLTLEFGLRYFTPNEIAKLHGFPIDGFKPLEVSVKPEYRKYEHSTKKAEEETTEQEKPFVFQYPNSLPVSQHYKLIGNSLNCIVVTALLEGLLHDSFYHSPE